jgi:hypothetical protein
MPDSDSDGVEVESDGFSEGDGVDLMQNRLEYALRLGGMRVLRAAICGDVYAAVEERIDINPKDVDTIASCVVKHVNAEDQHTLDDQLDDLADELEDARERLDAATERCTIAIAHLHFKREMERLWAPYAGGPARGLASAADASERAAVKGGSGLQG